MFREDLQNTGWVFGWPRFPGGLPLRKNGLDLIRTLSLAAHTDNFQFSGRNVNVNEIPFLDQCDGPPSAASGETWPIDGPVEAPEKRPSVIRAMERPNSLSEEMASEV